MSFFDGLERFAGEVEKFFKGKPEALNLRSCKNCPYHKDVNGVLYCTQTSPPTRILSEYYAQGCIYYGAEQPLTGLMTQDEREDYKSLLDRIKQIDLVDLISKITEVTTIKTLENLDLIKAVSSITDIVNIQNLESVELVDAITAIGTIDTLQNLTSIGLIDLINKISEITTIKKIESIEGGISFDPYGLTSKTKVLDKLAFAYDEDGNIDTIGGYEGEDQKFTLTFIWDAGFLTQIVRT